MSDLHTKYRPQDLESVVGQPSAIQALRTVISEKSSHSFLFTGPSGVGKTTLARIVSKMLGVDQDMDLMEIDAASNSGVDDMRSVVDKMHYLPSAGSSRACIVDECHALSKQAWQAALKACEEPPEHFYWFFCTTDQARVPETIKTRCTSIQLAAVDADDIYDRLDFVANQEKIDVPDEVLDVIVRSARGSMRAALVGLASCSKATTKEEASHILRQAIADKDSIVFVRDLVNGNFKSWKKAMASLDSIGDVEPESVRILVVAYITKMLSNAKEDQKAVHLLNLLDAFSTPCVGAIPKATLLLSIAKVIFEE